MYKIGISILYIIHISVYHLTRLFLLNFPFANFVYIHDYMMYLLLVIIYSTVTVDESSTGKNDVIGKKIESSYDVGFAPSFPVGQGKVIAGLDRGLIGLCKGSSAYIVIPPHLAYGRYGKPQQGVYGDTTLRYDVEIIDVQPPIPNDFIKIDANKDWKIR